MADLPIPDWDVYRDKHGESVTMTPEQCYAIMRGDVSTITGKQAKAALRALWVWAQVKRQYPGAGSLDLANRANIDKSRLLGRLIHEGLPPHVSPPPCVNSEPRYDLVAEPVWALAADLVPVAPTEETG